MTKLAEQDLTVVSKVLGITKEQLLSMTEEELFKEVDKIKQRIREVEQTIKAKDREMYLLRSKNISLRLHNAGMRLACGVRQIQIGFLRTVRDIKLFIINR